MGTGLNWVLDTLLNVAQSSSRSQPAVADLHHAGRLTFYLLRDWDRIVAKLDALLPRQHAAVIRAQGREIDVTLAGFARGQAHLPGPRDLLCDRADDRGPALRAGRRPRRRLAHLHPYLGAIGGFVIAMSIALVNFRRLGQHRRRRRRSSSPASSSKAIS